MVDCSSGVAVHLAKFLAYLAYNFIANVLLIGSINYRTVALRQSVEFVKRLASILKIDTNLLPIAAGVY